MPALAARCGRIPSQQSIQEKSTWTIDKQNNRPNESNESAKLVTVGQKLVARKKSDCGWIQELGIACFIC